MIRSGAAPGRAAPAAAPAAAVPRRAAADVAVIGQSLQAYAAAYLLAKRGKRTVLIEHAAPQLVLAGGGSSPGVQDIMLHLPATTPHLVNEATEAFALWRGVEAAADARGLIQLCGSIDVAPLRGSSAASDALGAMQDASRAAGLPFGMLSADEVSSVFPRLRLPRGSAALYTQLGGVVQGRLAKAVLRAMAQRAGADVAPAGRQRCLLGWRDAGGHFALRCAPAAAAAAAAAEAGAGAGTEEEVVWECEQLALLPEAAVQQQALAVFGLAVPRARLLRVPAGQWQAQEECAALPVWQLLGTGSSRAVDDPTAIDSCWGTPVLDWAPGRLLVAESLADGELAAEEGAAAAAGTEGAAASGGEQQQQQQPGGQVWSGRDGSLPEGAALLQAAGAEAGTAAAAPAAAAAAAASAAAGLAEEQPGSEEAVDRELQRLLRAQQRAEVAQRRLATAGSLAARLVGGVGARLVASEGAQLQLVCTPDGEPGVGSHPVFEQGRVVVAFPAAAAGPGCLPGDQLAPLVARLAVSELLGQPPEAVNAGLVALGREALGAEAVDLCADSWAELEGNMVPRAG